MEQVAPDVWAVPVPVARIPIRFTYAYVMRSGRDTVVIDPGARSAEGEKALADALDVIGVPARSLTGIVVTHYHFDHWEAADELADRSGAWIAIGADEQRWVDALDDDAVSTSSAAARFRAHGVPHTRAAEFAVVEDYRYTREHVRPDIMLQDGDLLPIARARLSVLATPGHSPGHICVHDEGRGLLFSGDHVLPRITPHIAMNPFGSEDPLAQYLESLNVVDRVGDVEVLPAHEYRFVGLQVRTQELRDDVSRRADEIRDLLRRSSGMSAWEIASTLSWSRPWSQFGVEAQRMAVVETAAFVAYLNRR